MRSSSFAPFLAIALASSALLSGCFLWKPMHPELEPGGPGPSAKAPKAEKIKAGGIAASTAAIYRERWIAQHTAALIAIGTPAASAPAQAVADFEKQFPGLLLK